MGHTGGWGIPVAGPCGSALVWRRYKSKVQEEEEAIASQKSQLAAAADKLETAELKASFYGYGKGTDTLYGQQQSGAAAAAFGGLRTSNARTASRRGPPQDSFVAQDLARVRRLVRGPVADGGRAPRAVSVARGAAQPAANPWVDSMSHAAAMLQNIDDEIAAAVLGGVAAHGVRRQAHLCVPPRGVLKAGTSARCLPHLTVCQSC